LAGIKRDEWYSAAQAAAVLLNGIDDEPGHAASAYCDPPAIAPSVLMPRHADRRAGA